jgi:hypothetical protein
MARPVIHTTPEAKLEGKRKSARETARKRREKRNSADMETWEKPLPADDPMAASDPGGVLVLDGEGPGGIPLPATVARTPYAESTEEAAPVEAPKRKRRSNAPKIVILSETLGPDIVEDFLPAAAKEEWE